MVLVGEDGINKYAFPNENAIVWILLKAHLISVDGALNLLFTNIRMSAIKGQESEPNV